jgi:hypothetical protein
MRSFRKSLGLLAHHEVDVPGLDRALAALDEYISFM